MDIHCIQKHVGPDITFCDAAVLVPFFEKDGDLHLLFTERTQTVEHHKGQICFPGGAKDPEDLSFWQTAIRETWEEVGLKPSQIFYVDELPDIYTVTFFKVTPFLGFIPADFELRPNPDEIARIITLPFEHFRDPKTLRYEKIEYFEQVYEVPFFKCGDFDIWGVTGKILVSLLERW